MAMNLEKELHDVGCDIPPDVFRDTVQETRSDLYPSWSDEELMRHPETHVPEYLWEVRRRCACRNIPDYVILGTLQNCRKKNRDA